MVKTVRIVGVPAGPAPLWVREKWVGLDLPVSTPRLVKRRAWKDFRVRGPLAYCLALVGLTPDKLDTWEGYIVDVDAAVAVLAARHLEAAAWWRENVPQLRGKKFMFDAASCSVVD